MRMFFTRYRRTISIIIIVIIALIISKIYIDMNKSWVEKVFSSEENLKYGDAEVTLGKYIASISTLSENQKVEYTILDIDSDKQNEILIKYFEGKKTRFALVRKENKSKIYDISDAINLGSLKSDGLFKKSDNNYAYITIENGNVFSNLMLYISGNKYYYNQQEITAEEYLRYLKQHIDSESIIWTSIT